MALDRDSVREVQRTACLIRLKKLSRVYPLCNEEQRGRLLSASEPLILELVRLGYERPFVETLLMCGKEFLDTLYHHPTSECSYDDAKVIFS